jgi:hypothetical protein
LAAARINGTGHSDVVVLKIFDVSENVVDKNKITDSRIFNMDETSHTVLQRAEKIVAQKGVANKDRM